MSRINRTEVLGGDLRGECLDQEHSSRPSMLYSAFQTMVTSRIPALPSLRRSLSDKRHRKVHSITELLAQTPPPQYTSRPGSGYVTPSHGVGEAEFDFPDDVSERPGSSASTSPPVFAAYETESGIKWRYASSGISLMSQAYHESTMSLRTADDMGASLIRQLYLHGMTYLLCGLPSNLTPEETLSLRAAIPQSVVDVRTEQSKYALIPLSERTALTPGAPQPEPSILHRITATVVFQTFLLLQFLLPYIKLLLASTYELERKHQITKRLVNTGVTTVDGLGRRSLRLSQTVCQMNDGKVGQAINDATLWWVRSVTGGVQQGIEEGLRTVRNCGDGR